MTDVGEGHLSLNGGDRDVSRNGGETGEGHLNMDVVEQPAADPLRDLLRADVISGDAADFTMGVGGRLTESEGRGKQCGGVLKDLNLDLGMATKQIPSQAVASHFTPGRNSFTDISSFEKKSWHSKASLAPFFVACVVSRVPLVRCFSGFSLSGALADKTGSRSDALQPDAYLRLSLEHAAGKQPNVPPLPCRIAYAAAVPQASVEELSATFRAL
eukprot:CAMPEP_0180209856 /NCGR_PEP_ID=MMETSP0987-20121128/11711_1 /TAXON_ID=697907 /ORGANISM="non described non described, Strain CCMP2293" /LENGTH=214 /DNA_ID=CAMNT_0022166527 /DNA_START=193 /DNA_END=836 /DNA_ORIENTATION=-